MAHAPSDLQSILDWALPQFLLPSSDELFWPFVPMETVGESDTAAPGPFEGSSASRAPPSIAHGMSLLLLPPIKLPQKGPYFRW